MGLTDDHRFVDYDDYRETLLKRIRRLEAGRKGLDAPPPDNPFGNDWPKDQGYLEMVERAKRQTDAELAQLREAVRLLDQLDAYSGTDDDVNTSIGELGTVLTSSVTGNETLFGRVDRHIGEWKGAAADAFADRVNKIHDLLNKQSAYAAVQQENLRQYRRLGDMASTSASELTTAMSRAWEAVDQYNLETKANKRKEVLDFTFTLVEIGTAGANKDPVGVVVAGAKYVFREKPTEAQMTYQSHADVLTEVKRLAGTALSALSTAAAKAAEAINETVEAMNKACAEDFPVRPAMLDVRSPEFSYEKFHYDTGITAGEREFLDKVSNTRDQRYPDGPPAPAPVPLPRDNSNDGKTPVN